MLSIAVKLVGQRAGQSAQHNPIAAGVLYPVLGLILSPMIAAAAMSFISVSVIDNALPRLRMPAVTAPVGA
ncbi:MAG: hypothetical protein ACSLE2_11460 [Lysobacterales bacterium]|jgi:Cu+-exporting ATPase